MVFASNPNVGQRPGGHEHTNSGTGTPGQSDGFERTDTIVFGLILFFGTLQFVFSERASGFLTDDVFYSDCARSILQHGYYGIQGRLETNQPPGLSAILALICYFKSCSHLACLRAMAVFDTMGFLVTYGVLRRKVSRISAAAICLLLMSSRIYFSTATQWVSPAFICFFFTMAALLVAGRLERSALSKSNVAWGVLLTVLCVASVMAATAAVALLGALVASIVIGLCKDRKVGITRLKLFMPAVVVGVMVQGLWMQRQPPPLEWPLPGYPQPYLKQLLVKEGNYPELGMAKLSDVPYRVARNALDDTNLLAELVLHRWINTAWMSALILAPLLLITLGWVSSVWPSGGDVCDWYFAGYEMVYLLWPWKFEARFFIPVAPLACVYLLRGVRALGLLAKQNSRVVGAVWLPAAIVLGIESWIWTRGLSVTRPRIHVGLQDELSFACWTLSAILAVWMIWKGSEWPKSSEAVVERVARGVRALRLNPAQLPRVLGVAAVICLILVGLVQQISIARGNLDLTSRTNTISSDAEAGIWIATNTKPDVVVMARHVPIVYHYAERKVVWFPPSTNVKILFDGLRRHEVKYVVVAHRENSYYLPPDDVSFVSLQTADPKIFRLVYESPRVRVFEIDMSNATQSGVNSASL
jgi:hypothetical protein